MPFPITPGRNQIEYMGIRRDGFQLNADTTTMPTFTYDATQPDGIPATVTGRALAITGDDLCAPCADGDAVVGKLEQIHPDNRVAFQFKGFASLAVGNAASVTRGLGIVGALGAASARGFVRQVNSAVAAELSKQGGSRIWNTANTGGGGDGTCVVDLGG